MLTMKLCHRNTGHPFTPTAGALAQKYIGFEGADAHKAVKLAQIMWYGALPSLAANAP
jgi:hypothetical protein